MIKAIIKPAVTLTAVCVIISFAIAFVNSVTEGPIAQKAEEQKQAAMQVVLPAERYEKLDNAGEVECYRATGGERDGYIFTASANGYGGEVSVMTAVYDDGTIAQIEVLSVSDETPGLGQNAKNDSFKAQFEGKSGQLTVVKNGASDNQIDAITSATITSKAVTSSVNAALSAFEAITGGASK